MKVECIECGDEFSPRRFALGYYTCLECGDTDAAYNKGAYMYVSSARMAREVGK